MSQKYKYWTYELNGAYCLFDFDIPSNLEGSLAEFQNNLKISKKEKDKAKANRDAESDDEKRSKLTEKYLKADDKYRGAKAKLAVLEEKQRVRDRNKGKTIRIERFKDIYSRKENVCVVLLGDGIEDGKIITTTSKIGEDIYRLEDYGMYLTPPYLDELAKAVKENYFDIEVQEREFVENEVSKIAIEAFVRMCREEIKDSNENFADKTNQYYNIPVKEFKRWYDNSSFRRFSLTSLKEALIIYEYARSNKGRNDYNAAGVGKVVSLYIANVQRLNDET